MSKNTLLVATCPQRLIPPKSLSTALTSPSVRPPPCHCPATRPSCCYSEDTGAFRCQVVVLPGALPTRPVPVWLRGFVRSLDTCHLLTDDFPGHPICRVPRLAPPRPSQALRPLRSVFWPRICTDILVFTTRSSSSEARLLRGTGASVCFVHCWAARA